MSVLATSEDGGGAQPPSGHACLQDLAADDPDEVDNGIGDHPVGLDELGTSGVERDAEAGVVRVDVGPSDGGVGDRDAQCLVGQQ
ncbi:MAG: hypothetical protein ACRDTX_02710 [Pseudonocardiaceae bacterium]